MKFFAFSYFKGSDVNQFQPVKILLKIITKEKVKGPHSIEICRQQVKVYLS